MPASPCGIELPPEIADARILDNKLRRASLKGPFLALTVAPHKVLDAEKALLHRFDLIDTIWTKPSCE